MVYMPRKLGRFQVMALLQAARYYVLTGDLKKALSFGLNRAIFYAWAKKTKGKVRPARSRRVRGVQQVKEKDRVVVYVGDEAAFVGPNGWFTIGREEQKPEDFEKNVASKIETVMPFEEAWKIAVEYVRSFGTTTLLSQRDFYEKVYKPVRDSFPEGAKKRPKQKTLF